MTETSPRATPECPDPLTQIVTLPELATRLGISASTLRGHLHAGTSWVPRPDGRINGGAVWRRASLEGIEARRRAPGRPARTTKTEADRTTGDREARAGTGPVGQAGADHSAPSAASGAGWWGED